MSDEEKKNEIERYAEYKLGGAKRIIPGLEESGRATTSQQNVVPYLRLTQPTSDAVTTLGIRPGVFYNSLTEEVLGERVEFIPIVVWHARRLFDGRDLRCAALRNSLEGIGDPGIVCSQCEHSFKHIKHQDGTLTPVDGFVRAKKGEIIIMPSCKEEYEYPSLILTGENKFPAVVSFRSTAFPQGVRLRGLLLSGYTDQVFSVSVIPMQNALGKWFSSKVNKVREMTEAEYSFARQLEELYRDEETRVDYRVDENGEGAEEAS